MYNYSYKYAVQVLTYLFCHRKLLNEFEKMMEGEDLPYYHPGNEREPEDNFHDPAARNLRKRKRRHRRGDPGSDMVGRDVTGQHNARTIRNRYHRPEEQLPAPIPMDTD